MIYALPCLLLSISYIFVISWIVKKWKNSKEAVVDKSFNPSIFISVVVPIRNESKHIRSCLESILKNNYPSKLFEIFVIDDHSEDDSVEIIHKLNNDQIRILDLENYVQGKEINSFKKAALNYAVQSAKGSVILCTDGDCVVDQNWIAQHAYQHEILQMHFATAPVQFHNELTSLGKFQSLDMLGLMAITQAGIHSQKYYMANGANMSFSKAMFKELNVFQEDAVIASGDDMFLVQAAAELNSQQVNFIKSKDASIRTEVQNNWKGYLSQRKRWATKSKSYQTASINILSGIVFLFCLSILICLVLGLVVNGVYLYFFAFQLMVKVVIDYWFLNGLANYFQRKELMKYFWISVPLHIFHMLFSGLVALFPSKYHWKGREVQ